PFIDVIYSLAKVCVFAVAVTLIHCYYGFYASGGPEGVGVAVGRAIRLSIVAVVILNLILSLVFLGGGNTVRVAGKAGGKRSGVRAGRPDTACVRRSDAVCNLDGLC